jgi:hypothetical protein
VVHCPCSCAQIVAWFQTHQLLAAWQGCGCRQRSNNWRLVWVSKVYCSSIDSSILALEQARERLQVPQARSLGCGGWDS